MAELAQGGLGLLEDDLEDVAEVLAKLLVLGAEGSRVVFFEQRLVLGLAHRHLQVVALEDEVHLLKFLFKLFLFNHHILAVVAVGPLVKAEVN